jgi:hypothetical protein
MSGLRYGVFIATVALVAGCGSGGKPARSPSFSVATASPSTPLTASVTPSPDDSISASESDLDELKKGDCVATGPSPIEVACDSPRAVAKVLDRDKDSRLVLEGPGAQRCPDETDQALTVTAAPPSGVTAPAFPLPVGYLCLRNLRPPHPGAPGKGGGAIVVGDCVSLSASGTATEVPCDGSGDEPATHKITEITSPIIGGSCPKGKGRVSFKLPRDFLNVYCAKRL